MSPLKIQAGTIINYKLSLHGIPLTWRTLIKEWKPGSYFIDYQMSGPYKIWHHKHSFTQLKDGVLMEDKVLYKIPFSYFSDFFIGWWIKKDVSRIFSYRTKELKKLIGPAIHPVNSSSLTEHQVLHKSNAAPQEESGMNQVQ